MTFTWDPHKSAANLRDRGFDFEFATRAFEGFTLEGVGWSGVSSQPGGATKVSGKHTLKPPKAERSARGRADMDRLRNMTEEEVAATSPPELADLPDDFWDDAVVVVPDPKEAISLRVDRDVLGWFRAQGPRYQTRMNAVLRSYMMATERFRE